MKALVIYISFLFSMVTYAHGGRGGHGSGGHGSSGGGFHGGSSTTSFHVGGSAGIRCNDPGFYGAGYAGSIGIADNAYWYQLGYNAQNDEDYDAAITDFTKAIEKDSTDADSYNYRGMAYCQVGESYKAIMDFDEVIKLNPNKASAYNNRAAVFESLGMIEAAVKDYQRAVYLKPLSRRFKNNLKAIEEKYTAG